jgi:hypothetical protein
MMDLAEFTNLVNAHDLTYDYSDDHRVWRNGQAQYDTIVEAAKQFPREEVVKIWNSMVRKSVVEECWNQFYWRI